MYVCLCIYVHILQRHRAPYLVKPIQMTFTHIGDHPEHFHKPVSDRPKMGPIATSVNTAPGGLKIESEILRDARNHNPVSDRPKSTSLWKKSNFGFLGF